jgi:hypothetical protein
VKVLVAYYSLSGYTESLAKAIVVALGGATSGGGGPAGDGDDAGAAPAAGVSSSSDAAAAPAGGVSSPDAGPAPDGAASPSRGFRTELLEVVPTKPYSYFSAGVKGVTQAMAGTIVELAGPSPGDDGFEALVVLSPTWGWMSSPPIRSFVAALPDGAGRPAVVGVTHAGGPIGSFDRLAGLVEERGYRVLERLSVFCYDRAAISAAAELTAAALRAQTG